MTGPDINRPRPGSNSIGQFTIGVSPIGTIALFDYWNTIISQYANSPIITQLISNMFDYIDQTKNFDAFFDLIWNVDTARGEGLDIWGRIVGVGRIVAIPAGEFFGMEGPTGASGTPYNVAPFYHGDVLTDNYALTDSAYRTLILAKALANICDGSMKGINQLLRNLFPGRGNCYVTDGQNMTMTYTFEFPLTPVEKTIVSNSSVLPKPVGVSVSIVQL